MARLVCKRLSLLNVNKCSDWSTRKCNFPSSMEIMIDRRTNQPSNGQQRSLKSYTSKTIAKKFFYSIYLSIYVCMYIVYIYLFDPVQTPVTPSEKKLSIIGTITGGKLRKRSGLLGIFTQNKVNNFLLLLDITFHLSVNIYIFIYLSHSLSI